MNKLFTKIATAFVGIAMAIGVGVAIGSGSDVRRVNADDVLSNTIIFGGGTKIGSYTSSFDETDSASVDWTITNFNNNNWNWSSSVSGANKQIKVGNKTAASVGTIQNKAELTNTKFSKVDLYISARTNNYINSIKVYGGASSSSVTTELATVSSVTPSATTPTTLTLTNQSNYKFYKIAFDMKKHSSSNGLLTLDKVCWYTASSASTLPKPTSLTQNNGVLGWGAVANKSSYEVVYDGTTYSNISSNSYTVSNYQSGSHSFKVRAVGNGTTYLTSDWSDVLAWDDRIATSITINGGASTLELDTNSSPTALTIVTSPADLTLSYNSSDTNVATISAGTITVVGEGTTTITVSFAGSETLAASSATITVNVTKALTPISASGSFVIDSIDKIGPSTGYADYNGTHYSVATEGTGDIAWVSYQVMPGSSSQDGTLQFQGNNGYIYNTTSLSNILSVTVNNHSGTAPTIYYGKTVDNITLETLENGCGFFKVYKNSASAGYVSSIEVEWGTPITLDGITAELDSTAAQKTWYVNDPLTAAEVDVTPSYSDGSGTKVEDGTGVYFNSGLTETTYTFSTTGNVTIPVYYRDANGRTANTTFTVINVQPAKTVQAWSITGEIGETAKTVDYDLSGLTLHAWYDAQKTDEASSEVAALYELVANPTTAGESSDPNNTINVEVYLKTDTSHTNRLALFENVAAPIVDAPKGSEDNPYTVAEAMAAITWTTNTSSDDEYYAIGFVKKVVSASTNHSYYLVDDPNDTTFADKECLQAYSRDEPTDWDANATGDKVKVKGYLTYYNGQKELGKSGSGNGFSIISVDPETLSLTLSVTEEDVIINSTYSYSGTITADYKHKNDVVYDGVDSRFTITSNVNTAVVGDYTYTVTYDDGIFEEIEESCAVHVKYAEVSSVTLTEHNVPMGIDDGHQFTASLNEGVNPSNVISWSVANDVGSEIPTSEFEIDETGYLVISTQTPGTLIVTASCAGFSDHCTVTVTGDPYATFNKVSIKGIANADVDNSVTAIPNGLAGTPTSYTWSIKTGEATDVISFTNGNASTTLTFLKAGSTVLHVVISDGSAKTAEGDIDVDVIDSLHSVVVPGKTTESSDTTTFSEMGLENGVQYESLTSPSDSNITFAFGNGGNDGKYYDGGSAIRVYSGGHMTVAHASKTISKIELTFGSGEGSNEITTEVGTYSNGTWTGSSSSVTFNVGGSSGHRRIASVTVYWEVSGSDTPVSNINYNSQKAILDFASQFSTMLNNVCDQATGDTPMSGDDGLIKKWGDIQSAFTNFRNSLSTSAELGEMSEREIFDALIANAGKDQGGDALEKALSSYDYVYSKYHAALDGEVAGSADFLHNVSERDPVSYAPRILPTLLVGKVTNTSIIVIVTVGIAVIAIGGYFLLRKKKED